MEFITEIGDRKYYFHALNERALDFLLFKDQEFILLICIDHGEFEPQRMKLLVEYILRSNVRYVVCAGSAAEKVHDLFDEVISQEHWDEKRGEAILTTWHDKESVEEVVFQFVRLTFPEQSEPKVSLMLFPSKDKRAQDYIACLKEIERTSK